MDLNRLPRCSSMHTCIISGALVYCHDVMLQVEWRVAGQLRRSFSSRRLGICRLRAFLLMQGMMPSSLTAMKAAEDFVHSVQAALSDRYVTVEDDVDGDR